MSSEYGMKNKKQENISISYAFTVLEFKLVQMENNYMVEHCQIVFFKNYIMLQQKGELS